MVFFKGIEISRKKSSKSLKSWTFMAELSFKTEEKTRMTLKFTEE